MVVWRPARGGSSSCTLVTPTSKAAASPSVMARALRTNLRRTRVPRLSPVTNAVRSQISCTTYSNGKVSGAVQSRPTRRRRRPGSRWRLRRDRRPPRRSPALARRCRGRRASVGGDQPWTAAAGRPGLGPARSSRTSSLSGGSGCGARGVAPLNCSRADDMAILTHSGPGTHGASSSPTLRCG